MDKIVEEVMQVDKVVKLFQTMAIVNINMGNSNLEVSSLKNRLHIKEKEKAILQVQLDKERNFQREYKHNVKIWRKNRIENEQKIKTLVQKLQNENKELKVKTTLMKSQEEDLKELKKIIEAWETTQRKWVDTLFHYRQQHEALGSLVEPLSKEKEKDNVLIDLELVNLKSASLLDFEKLKRRTTKAKKEEVGGCK